MISKFHEFEDIFRDILNAIEDPVFVKDEKHRWLILNNKFCEMIGRSPEELIGKSDFDLFPHEEASIFWKKDDHVLSTGESNMNEERITWDGHQRIISTKKKLLISPSGDRKYIVGVIRDVTEQVSNQKRLQSLSILHQGILSSLPHGLCIIDNERRISWANNRLKKIFHIKEGHEKELIGMPLQNLFGGLDDFESFWKLMYDDLTNNSRSIREVCFKSDDGSDYWCEISAVFYNNQDPSSGIICTITDITSLVKAEMRERENQKQLITADRMQSVGRLAAGVAHEINNPLAVLYGMLQDLNSTGQTPTKRNYEVMLTVTRRIKEIVYDLLTFSRQRGDQKFPHQVNDIIRDVLNIATPHLKKNNVILEIKLAENLPMANIAPGLIQQVFLNLILNACDSMPDGGELVIESSNVTGNIEISFRDTGEGIPAEIQEKIFLPFFTTRDVGEGTGLGLAISYGIVQDHNGNITVHSAEGKGSQFIVSLPQLT